MDLPFPEERRTMNYHGFSPVRKRTRLFPEREQPMEEDGKLELSSDSNKRNVSGSRTDMPASSLHQMHHVHDNLHLVEEVRVSLKTRVDDPAISDGCVWWKYGQKTMQGNPHPRVYYRCMMSMECPVRKQVQRCGENHSILSTTYIGEHNHPLPPEAMAMSSIIMSAKDMCLPRSGYNKDYMPRETTSLLSRANIYVSSSPQYPTIVLDMTNPCSPPGVEVDPAATAPQVVERLTTFWAAALTSFIDGTPEP